MFKHSRIGRSILDIAEIILFSLVLSWSVRSYVVETREVPTGSMLPTIKLEDRVVVDKLFFRYSKIYRGEVVVFHPPSSSELNQDLIKRVIGLPGEKIAVKQGKVYINDQPINEPYILEDPTYTYPPYVIPADTYFVMGDNRNDSYDSHWWGVLPADQIIGRAVFRFWPLNHLGTF